MRTAITFPHYLPAMFVTKTTILSKLNIVLKGEMGYTLVLVLICIEHKTEISNSEVVFIG